MSATMTSRVATDGGGVDGDAGLQQLLTDSEDASLRRQVRGVLKAVGTIKDETHRPSHAPPRTSVTAGKQHAIAHCTDTKQWRIQFKIHALQRLKCIDI